MPWLTESHGESLFIASAAHVCPDHDTSADEGGYRFFAACQRNQYDQVTTCKGESFGLFPHHVCRILRERAPENNPVTSGEIADLVKNALKNDAGLKYRGTLAKS